MDASGTVPKKGTTVALFQTQMVGMAQNPSKQQYSVAPDGRRFLLNVTAGESSAAPITIVTNRTRALKK
jgi:hypothetical protein